MNTAARHPKPSLWRCLVAGGWDFIYAGVCLAAYIGWWRGHPWLTQQVEALRWWPVYEGFTFLALLALFLIVAPDLPPEQRWRKSRAEWFWQGLFLLLIITLTAGVSWTASNSLGLFSFFLLFMTARLAGYFITRDTRPFGGFVELVSYLTLAFIPLAILGMAQEMIFNHQAQTDYRFFDLTHWQRSSLTLVGLGIPFYIGYGVFHAVAVFKPSLADFSWFMNLGATQK